FSAPDALPNPPPSRPPKRPPRPPPEPAVLVSGAWRARSRSAAASCFAWSLLYARFIRPQSPVPRVVGPPASDPFIQQPRISRGHFAGPEGLEPPTPGFGDRCSARLSYGPPRLGNPPPLRTRPVYGPPRGSVKRPRSPQRPMTSANGATT